MRRLLVLSTLLAACVPVDPLDLEPPDASPPECVTASECDVPAVAEVACIDGRCAIAACPAGTADADGDRDNGCEACDARPGPDRCDGEDSDCDGRLDEDGDDTIDACGACDVVCAGPDAAYLCRDDACLIESCAAGRFAIGGSGAGCPCATDELAVRRMALRPPTVPVAPRLAFPGGGEPGAVVWTAVEDGRHRLMRWGLTPDGYPIGPPEEVAALDGPHDVRDAWFDRAGDLLTLLAAPDGNAEALTVWRDAEPLDLGDDCTPARCRVVRLPDGEPGLVRLDPAAEGPRVFGPDGDVIAALEADPEGAPPALVDAACLSGDECLVAIRRGGVSLTGLANPTPGGLDDFDLARVGDQIWLVARSGDRLLATSTNGEGGDNGVIELPVTGWRTPRLLPVPGDGAWLVATDDGDAVALRLGPAQQPMGEARRLTAGFVPEGIAGPGVFFDHSPRAATVERVLWVGVPDSAPIPGVAPRTVGPRIVYRGRSGLFAAPWSDEGSAAPELLLRQPSPGASIPATGSVDGRSLAVDAVPEGLAVVDLDRGARQIIALRIDDQPAVVRPSPAVALGPDGTLAIVAERANGQAVLGLGTIGDVEFELRPSDLGPERAPLLVGDATPAWLLTRLDPGVGHQTVVRQLGTDAPPRLVGRRFAPQFAAAAHGENLLVIWLDRLTDRCGDAPDQIMLTVIPADGSDPAPATELAPGSEPLCPRDVAFADSADGAYALVSADTGLHMLAFDAAGQPAAPPVQAPVEIPGGLGIADDAPTGLWVEPDGIARLPFDCREPGAGR